MTYNFTSPVTCNAGLLGPSLVDVCSASTFVVFMSILNEFVRTTEKISGICERVIPVNTTDEEYNFVVIGAGAAGSVVASRLSEIPEWKVLLLEAGPDEPAGSGIPSFVLKFLGTELDWNYTSINESYACLAKNGSCSWPSGKNLGGNTVHSAMGYLRGSPKDFEEWVALGNNGWGWGEVEPYFLKSEGNREIDRVGTAHHATEGPLPVQRYPFVLDLDHSILAAANESGYGVSEDLNGETTTGFSVLQASSINGVKYSTARAFLSSVRNRKNLHVSLNSLATRIIVENGTAVGVEYLKDGKLMTVSVAQEVVISAGTMRSPQILLLSGIGPRKVLESVGVEVVKELAGVGDNYQNHISYRVNFVTNDPDLYENSWAAAAEYLAFQTGPMSCPGLATVVGMLASNATTPDHPDLEIFGSGSLASCAPGEIDALRSTGPRTLTMSVTYTQPKSRGRITLASKDPSVNPVVWTNYLSNYSDVEGLLDGVDKVLTLAKTQALKAHNLTLSIPVIEACSNYTYLSTDYWVCLFRQNTYPANHHAGSCKMGPKSDPMAVVDPELRVNGVNRLRIADASIMPQITSSPPATATMMIAERAADLVKKAWSGDSGE